MGNSIERIYITVDGATHALGPLEQLDDIKAQILAAAAQAGGFLDVCVDGGQRLSIFVTASSSISIAVATARLDAATADENPSNRNLGDEQDYEDGSIPFDII